MPTRIRFNREVVAISQTELYFKGLDYTNFVVTDQTTGQGHKFDGTIITRLQPGKPPVEEFAYPNRDGRTIHEVKDDGFDVLIVEFIPRP